MANDRDTPVEYVTGVVGKTNDRGFTLDGREGWINVSKYASPQPMIPAPHTAVRVGLDKGGFARSIERASGDESIAPSAPAQPAGTAPAAGYPTNDERERRITKLAVLNTATAVLSSGGRAAEADAVLRLAARFERWVQGDEPVPATSAHRTGQDPEEVLGATADGTPVATRKQVQDRAAALGIRGVAGLRAALGLRADTSRETGPYWYTEWEQTGRSWEAALDLLKTWAQQQAADEPPF